MRAATPLRARVVLLVQQTPSLLLYPRPAAALQWQIHPIIAPRYLNILVLGLETRPAIAVESYADSEAMSRCPKSYSKEP